MIRRRWIFLIGPACLTLWAIPDSPEGLLETLAEGHPRILVSTEDFASLRSREWDAVGGAYRELLTQTGYAMLDVPPITHELVGRRLLHESRRLLKRVTTWALLYRLEGEPLFRDRAIAEMEAAVSFPDWNPSHFLDVGEMALGLAIGTDWLWDELTPAQRERFITALIEKGIQPSLDEDHDDNWWLYYYNNWNPVCHAGLVAAALLAAEREPQLATKVIKRAVRALPFATKAYQPAGAYPEGPVYWDYGTAFTAILLDLLERGLGTTFGLSDEPAFRASGRYRALVVAPSGRFYNYADCGESDRFAAATAWFASRLGDPAATYEMARGLRSYLKINTWDPANSHGRDLPFVALWYPDSTILKAALEAELPHLWLGPGPNPIGLVRESWGDPKAFFLGFKGNDGSVSHAHLDAGSFVFEDAGVRWAIELGAQDYTSLENENLGMWDRRLHSDRWRIFRVGPRSHNLLLIDERLPDATAKAEIVHLAEHGDQIVGTVDLTPVHPDQAEHYERQFKVHSHTVLEIIDKIRGARGQSGTQGGDSATLHWRMLTRADTMVTDDTAKLRQDGQVLTLRVLEPDAFILRAAPVDPPPYYWDAPNPGVTAIDVWAKVDSEGDQTVRVVMSTEAEALDAFTRPSP